MSNLKNKIRAGEFVITAEIVPPLSAASAKLLHEASSSRARWTRSISPTLRPARLR